MNFSKKNDKTKYKYRRSKFAKTMKKGGDPITLIAATFTLCMSVLQFTYYITAINKNTQPSGPNILTISETELNKIKHTYPRGNPLLITETDMTRLKGTTPKLIKDALDQKYIKKIRRKNIKGEMIEGYTLAAKGKELITSNIEKIGQ